MTNSTPTFDDSIGDIIDVLTPIGAASPVHELRTQRADIARFIQGSYHALLEPDDPGGISREERDLIALRVATLTSNYAVAEHHRERLRGRLPDSDVSAVEQFPTGQPVAPRLALILRHVDRLTLDPRSGSRAAIEELQAGGLSSRDIVIIAQLTAFLSFQIRLMAGLRALGETV